MSEPLEREWRFYVSDMLGFAEKVVLYTDGLDQERFVASGLNYDATVHNLILLGEAAMHVPESVRTFAARLIGGKLSVHATVWCMATWGSITILSGTLSRMKFQR